MANEQMDDSAYMIMNTPITGGENFLNLDLRLDLFECNNNEHRSLIAQLKNLIRQNETVAKEAVTCFMNHLAKVGAIIKSKNKGLSNQDRRIRFLNAKSLLLSRKHKIVLEEKDAIIRELQIERDRAVEEMQNLKINISFKEREFSALLSRIEKQKKINCNKHGRPRKILRRSVHNGSYHDLSEFKNEERSRRTSDLKPVNPESYEPYTIIIKTLNCEDSVLVMKGSPKSDTQEDFCDGLNSPEPILTTESVNTENQVCDSFPMWSNNNDLRLSKMSIEKKSVENKSTGEMSTQTENTFFLDWMKNEISKINHVNQEPGVDVAVQFPEKTPETNYEISADDKLAIAVEESSSEGTMKFAIEEEIVVVSADEPATAIKESSLEGTAIICAEEEIVIVSAEDKLAIAVEESSSEGATKFAAEEEIVVVSGVAEQSTDVISAVAMQSTTAEELSSEGEINCPNEGIVTISANNCALVDVDELDELCNWLEESLSEGLSRSSIKVLCDAGGTISDDEDDWSGRMECDIADTREDIGIADENKYCDNRSKCGIAGRYDHAPDQSNDIEKSEEQYRNVFEYIADLSNFYDELVHEHDVVSDNIGSDEEADQDDSDNEEFVLMIADEYNDDSSSQGQLETANSYAPKPCISKPVEQTALNINQEAVLKPSVSNPEKQMVLNYYQEAISVPEQVPTNREPFDEMWDSLAGRTLSEAAETYAFGTDQIPCIGSVLEMAFMTPYRKLVNNNIERQPNSKPFKLDKAVEFVKSIINNPQKLDVHVNSTPKMNHITLSIALLKGVLSVAENMPPPNKQQSPTKSKRINDSVRLLSKYATAVRKTREISFYDVLLRTFERKMFTKEWPAKGPSLIQSMILLSKFYAQVCHAEGDVVNVRRLLHQALKELKYRANPIGYGIFSVWTNKLYPSEVHRLLLDQIVLFAFVNYTMKYNHALYKVKELQMLINTSYHVKLGCRSVTEYSKYCMQSIDDPTWVDAVTLLCRRQMFDWAYTYFVVRYFIPLMKKWLVEELDEVIIIKIVAAMRTIILSCPDQMAHRYNFDNIIDLLGHMLYSDKAGEVLKDNLVLLLATLSKYRIEGVAALLTNYKPQMISPELVRLIKTNFKCNRRKGANRQPASNFIPVGFESKVKPPPKKRIMNEEALRKRFEQKKRKK